MDKQLVNKLQKLLVEIYSGKKNFYKSKFLKAGIRKKDIEDLNLEIFNKLPVTTVKELVNNPYDSRCLKEEQGLNKLVNIASVNKYILIHKTLKEIKRNPIFLEGKRPMVILQDLYESLEHCLYFYQQKRIPLIGEVTIPGILYSTAVQYLVDSLIIDNASKKLFYTELLKLKLPLKSVTIIDSNFEPEGLIWPKKISCNYFIYLPEFGICMYLCKEALKKSYIFHAVNGVYIEPGKKTILTNANLSACPMIRYESNLYLEAKGKCSCGKQGLEIKN